MAAILIGSKLMKLSLLISLAIIAIAMMLYIKPWTRDGAAGEDRPGPPPTDRFMRQCATVFADRTGPKEYCQCLWRKGVRNPGETLATKTGRAAAAACE